MSCELTQKLQKHFKKEVELTLKDNKCVFLRLQENARKKIRLILHKQFAKAPDEVVYAVFRYIAKRDRNALSLLRRFVESNTEPSVKKTKKFDLKGDFFDLAEILEKVEEKYFEETFQFQISWFTPRAYTRVRHITFGSYDQSQKLIRINKILDDPKVPPYFLSFVIFHEILHHVFPPIVINGRRSVHGIFFKQHEKKHSYYHESKVWEKKIFQFIKNRQKNGRT